LKAPICHPDHREERAPVCARKVRLFSKRGTDTRRFQPTHQAPCGSARTV